MLPPSEAANSVTKLFSQHLHLLTAKKNANNCAVLWLIVGTTHYLQSIPQVFDGNNFLKLPLQGAQGCLLS